MNLWEGCGYVYLGLSAKRLRDKAASAEEKHCGDDVPESQKSIVMANSILMEEEETKILKRQITTTSYLIYAAEMQLKFA